MKIVDRAQDYYDFAGMGRDDSIVFHREQQFICSVTDAIGLPDGFNVSIENSDRDEISFRPFYALLGGIGVPGVVVERQAYDGYSYGEIYHYRSGNLTNITDDFAKNIDRLLLKRVRGRIDEIKTFIDKGPVDLTEFACKHRFITGVVIRNMTQTIYSFRGDEKRSDEATFMPMRMQDIGIQDILPAHEAHMMVSRFVGGILPFGPDTVELSDKSKIIKAGFDLKSSFRKPKEDSSLSL